METLSLITENVKSKGKCKDNKKVVKFDFSYLGSQTSKQFLKEEAETI